MVAPLYELNETEKLFTPRDIDPGLCMTRTWADGVGGQCMRSPEETTQMCGLHGAQARELGELPHGRVDGPIPPKKLAQFMRSRARGSKNEEHEAIAVPAGKGTSRRTC